MAWLGGIIIGLIVGAALGFVLKSALTKKDQEDAQQILDDAKHRAEDIVREAKIAAKEELLHAKDEFEKSTKERRQELQKLEERLAQKEANLDRKADLVDSRFAGIEAREKKLREREAHIEEKHRRLDELINEEITELQRVAGMNREEARKLLLSRLGQELDEERGSLIRRFQDEAAQQLERKAQEIMITAMQRYAGDCAYERTTATVPLPNEDMKGRIIGREGRNIRTIEAACGVSVLIDDTPEAVVISCFDPVRREIARVALERLVADGRIHPTRIEEMVEKARKEIEEEILKAGQDALDTAGVTRVRPNLVRLLGRLKYRYSYSQNVLRHSIEVAHLMGAIAAQLNLDEQKARRAGLFHDIGKAVDHEVEGSHAAIGADLLRRAGESEDVVNAVAAHHEEVEKNSLLANLVEICDTLSASRPGARSESTELYIKRLEKLEEIGRSFDGVDACYAIQAGRELRVIIEPEKITENKAATLARDIAARIEKEMRYPGQIRVTVIRETRAVHYAK